MLGCWQHWNALQVQAQSPVIWNVHSRLPFRLIIQINCWWDAVGDVRFSAICAWFRLFLLIQITVSPEQLVVFLPWFNDFHHLAYLMHPLVLDTKWCLTGLPIYSSKPWGSVRWTWSLDEFRGRVGKIMGSATRMGEHVSWLPNREMPSHYYLEQFSVGSLGSRLLHVSAFIPESAVSIQAHLNWINVYWLIDWQSIRCQIV